jgi:hypothetical protein
MTDLLAIVGEAERDKELIAEIERRRPGRVTLLVEEELLVEEDGEDGAHGRPAGACRERLAALLGAIEERTGAIVVGMARSREQLRGWRFDRIIGGGARLMA